MQQVQLHSLCQRSWQEQMLRVRQSLFMPCNDLFPCSSSECDGHHVQTHPSFCQTVPQPQYWNIYEALLLMEKPSCESSRAGLFRRFCQLITLQPSFGHHGFSPHLSVWVKKKRESFQKVRHLKSPFLHSCFWRKVIRIHHR